MGGIIKKFHGMRWQDKMEAFYSNSPFPVFFVGLNNVLRIIFIYAFCIGLR